LGVTLLIEGREQKNKEEQNGYEEEGDILPIVVWFWWNKRLIQWAS
jgi:hypothetical protein